MLVKICGMSKQADLDLASELGVDFCGFIFHPQSPRNVLPQEAKELDSGVMRRVGVFVKQDASEILKIMAAARLDFCQLHGQQTAADAQRIGPERVIRVLWPQKYSNLQDINRELQKFASTCAYFLLDAGMMGGSGKCLDWDELRNLDFPNPWFLAGGLGKHNIAQAVRSCSPYGLDLNSGVESGPGQKDQSKMRSVMEIIRQINGD